MEELWTPWRMSYITSPPKGNGCVFCHLLDHDDENGLILSRGPHCFVVMNLFPYTVGHAMVIPYRHLGRAAELNTQELQELSATAARTERILRRDLGAEQIHHGINLGRPAGAGVEGHLHLHLVPRGTRIPTKGQGTDLPIPLEVTSRLLREAFARSTSDGTDR